MKSRLTLVFLAVFIVAPLAQSQDNPAFAGFYKLGDPIEVDQGVRLTITLRIGNYSEYPISGAIILLIDPNPPGSILGVFPGKLDAGSAEMQQFEGDFTIAQSIYDEWQKGLIPDLRVSYINSDGHEVLGSVILSRRWVDDER